MEMRTKALAVLLVLLALVGGFGYTQHKELQALADKHESLEKQHTALIQSVQQYAAQGNLQATQRNKAAHTVQAVRNKINKENNDAQESKPSASAAQLGRLRELREAGEQAISDASELH